MKTKKLIAVAVVISLGTQLFAQSEYHPALRKGSVLAGGSISLGFGNHVSEYNSPWGNGSDEVSQTSIAIKPMIGSFIKDGLVVGLYGDLTSETFSDKSSDSKQTVLQYAIGPIARYYFKAGTFLFGDIAFGQAIYNYSGQGGSEESKGDRSLWKAGIGHAIFLNEHVALEPSVAYQSNSTKESEDGLESVQRIGQVVFGLGLSIYLRKASE